MPQVLDPINVNITAVANQGYDSLPTEVKPANQTSETIPASAALANTDVANQGFGHGIAITVSGAVR